MNPALVLSYLPSLIGCDSADFDGTNDYMTRGAGLTGAADSNLFTLSFWYRLDAGDGTKQTVLCAATSVGSASLRFEIYRDTNNKWTLVGYTSGGIPFLVVATDGTFVAGAGWHHFYTSVSMADAANSFIYIDDIEAPASASAFSNNSIDFTVGDWVIGAIGDGSSKFNGVLAELWFQSGLFAPANIAANRRKFITAGLKPVFLGVNGSIPTGTAPLIYSSIGKSEAVANFATNRGVGGNFTITGTLDTGSTSPSG